MKKISFSALLVLCCMVFGTMNAQEAYKIGLVGFYNLENLFDTINDPNITDGEFTPEGANQWNTENTWPNCTTWPMPSPPSVWTTRPMA